MSLQTAIEFPVHRIENNAGSQRILETNSMHFTQQCRIVYNCLMASNSITTTQALGLGIGDLRARIRDLKKINKVAISERLIERRFKEWFMTEEDITFNREKERQ